jgi:hypothetical protein
MVTQYFFCLLATSRLGPVAVFKDYFRYPLNLNPPPGSETKFHTLIEKAVKQLVND